MNYKTAKKLLNMPEPESFDGFMKWSAENFTDDEIEAISLLFHGYRKEDVVYDIINLSGYSDYEREVILSLCESGMCYEDAIEALDEDNYSYYSGWSLLEVAEDIVDQQYDLPLALASYFDYEAFARDLVFDGYTETCFGVIQVD